MEQERVALKVGEAAARLGISRTKAYEMAQRGELPGAFRVGASLRVNARRLDQWIDEASGPKPAGSETR